MHFSRRYRKSLLSLVNLSLIFCSVIYPSFSETTQKKSLAPLKYEIDNVYVGSLKHTITIINHSPFPIWGELIVPLIENETERHYVILQNISNSKVNDSSGNTYFHLDSLRLGGGQTFSLELNYHVLSFRIHYVINSSIVEDYDTSSDLYKKYTEQEELIECDNSKIVSLVHNLTDNVDDVHEKALKIYNFVYHHVHYEAQDEEMGALWALENRIGDCSEYSYLFVAMCRAAGVPARIQAGFAFHRTSETLKDGHMWTEYYLENYGWIPADVTWQLFDVVDDKHFSSIQSVPEAVSYANYVFDCKREESYVEDEQTVSLTPCSTNVFGDLSVENIVKTVEKTRQAKFAIFLGKIFGTHIIFPSEVKEIEQTSLESEIQLQNAINLWNESPKIAESNAVNALGNVEETLKNAWMIIAKTLIILISIPITIMLLGLLSLKQYKIKQDKNPEQKLHLHDTLILS